MKDYQICKKCVCDSSVSNVSFNSDGICNYCKIHDEYDKMFPPLKVAEFKKENIFNQIKKAGKKRKYDIVIGVSGGRDSIYSLYLTKKMGLRPLAVHFDNGWVSDIAKKNIQNAVKKLKIDLKVLHFPKILSLYKACLFASVPDVCLPCSIGVGSSLYQVALKEKVRFINIAISFRTEGVNPLKENYCDGRYFNYIMKNFSKDNIVNFNKMNLINYFNYIFIHRIKLIQLPYYLKYNNNEIDKILKNELDWVSGGRHHFDCEFKPLSSFIKWKKFHFDDRRICYSAQVRENQMKREDAIKKLSIHPSMNDKVLNCLRKLNITQKEFDKIMSMQPKSFLDYPNYYSLISQFKPLFKILSKFNLLPESIYEKLFKV
jgi:hypothetical protein